MNEHFYDSGQWRLCIARGNTKSFYTTASWVAAVLRRVIRIENELIKRHPNKRVVHLALNGYGRTRKKNRNRALRYFKRKEKK